MKISISYHYPIRYVPYRHQNTQSELAAASTVVDIREIPETEAPVVLRIGHADQNDYKARKFAFKDNGDLREIRQFEGALYVEDGAASELQAAVDKSIDASPLGHRYNSIHQRANDAYGRIKPPTTKEKIIAAHRNPLRSIEDDGGAALAKRLQARADRILIINGTLYKKCREPVLAFDLDDQTAKILEAPGPRYEGLDTIDYIGTDMTSNLVEATDVLANMENAPTQMTAKWEVIDPRFASFDGTTFDISRHYGTLRGTLDGKASGLQRNMLDLMFALRDADPGEKYQLTPAMLDLVNEARSLEVNESEEMAAKNCFDGRSRFGMTAIQRIIFARADDKHQDVCDSLVEVADKIVARWALKPENWIKSNWGEEFADDNHFDAPPEATTPEYC